MLADASDRDDIIGARTEFLAQGVDQQIDAVVLSHHARQRFAGGRFGDGKDSRLYLEHPFAPAQIRWHIRKLAIKKTFVSHA